MGLKIIPVSDVAPACLGHTPTFGIQQIEAIDQ